MAQITPEGAKMALDRWAAANRDPLPDRVPTKVDPEEFGELLYLLNRAKLIRHGLPFGIYTVQSEEPPSDEQGRSGLRGHG